MPGFLRADGPVTGFEVLFVCTGNLHRSPVAERLLAAALPEPDFRVRSAGTEARPVPLDSVTRAIVDELGGYVREFTARRLDVGQIERADLVLGLERRHREAVVRLCPLALRRCFTLREFIRLMDRARAGTPREAVRLAASRRGLVVPAPGESDGIDDPVGAAPDVHRARALEVRDAVLTLAGILGR
ncbi:arsenate reductase/protein-tyrosine-phosphatase family protein [Streptomyces fulvoviolaceus]|uniref:arsenate reductase/protein-tyrosine-phosphatase family protein n=1 Tax=Streptomyces fulvoviolaceus TaxID=285535 RepID=UPI0021C0EC58|nr:low molecular weight phosphatase family protein [Streptomyces fulvoviolaceus]MCT9078931.1 low molecular weight phosphatase family protein [Streptomyces fulvoviolaceus]